MVQCISKGVSGPLFTAWCGFRQVYVFSKGKAQVADRRYNACNHEYEIRFDNGSAVVEKVDSTTDADAGKIGTSLRMHFVPLKTLKLKAKPCLVDCAGCILTAMPSAEVQGKDGGFL